jgi:hypothetical protein
VTQAKFLFRVEYKSAINGRIGRFYVWATYGEPYGLTETLMHAYLAKDIRWFRVRDVRPGEVQPEDRAKRLKWRDALAATTRITKVRFA